MKRYRFRLGPVLSVRRSEQDAARGALLAAIAAVGAEEDQLTRRSAAFADAAVPAGVTPAADFRRMQLHREALGAAVVEQRRRLEQARVEQESARGSWTEAAARVGALERLDERARTEHRLVEQREDDRLTDEIVVARFGWEVG